VSRITGVKPHVLRYWESEFSSLRPEKGPNDQRRYRASDIELIEQIKTLLYEEKFTIAGARRRLAEKAGAQDARPQPPAGGQKVGPPRRADIQRIASRLGRVRRELIELQAFLAG
jgi:DNA-binding transcriptional MerR regulator